MEAISIQGISKRYGDVTALHEISLSVRKGEFVTLLGPSGCGKTTTLRTLAGLERADTGRILIDGHEMFCAKAGRFVPPERRGLGMVFQSYAIWPHMTVYQNVAYELVARRLPKSEIRTRVREALAIVGLEGLDDRPATNLSGGQQQRVALARSLVGEPRVLLLDEPLSNLDAKLRERMRFELKQLQKRLGLTTVYVTHDQVEALALSDRIIVMDRGQIIQDGTGRDIYKNPCNRFVIDFVGQANFIEGTITSHDSVTGLVDLRSDKGFSVRGQISRNMESKSFVGAPATAAIRPEDIQLLTANDGATNVWSAAVISDLFLGNMRELLLDVGGQVFKAQVGSEQNIPNEHPWLRVPPEAVRILSPVSSDSSSGTGLVDDLSI
ncbi:ABC transporter ATP-binding protein [Pseudochelatococcus sp. B33]